jgi:sulfite reductase alpha subunit
MSETPMLDELEKGPFPSFVTEIKKAGETKEAARDLLRLLERSYKDKKTHWKHGGIVAVKGYGGGVIGRYCDLPDEFPAVAHFHTVRINQPTSKFYTTKSLRAICDIWEKRGSGITNFHGSTGDFVLLGTFTEELQPLRDDLAELDPPFDIGGSGSDLRTPSACIGPARCEWACYDTLDVCYEMTKEYQMPLHRPMWPYKFKIKCSGCPNDCVAAKARSDFAIIGTWRDDIKIDQNEVKEYAKIMDIQAEVVDLCPTGCMSWDGSTLSIDNANCVRCMHCINKMPKALAPGDDRGATVLIGAKAPMLDGSTIGWVFLPFVKLERPYDELKETLDNLWEWWDEEGKFRERVGELIWRKGVREVLKVLDIEPSPYMVSSPRNNPFMFFDKSELIHSDYIKELERRGIKLKGEE